MKKFFALLLIAITLGATPLRAQYKTDGAIIASGTLIGAGSLIAAIPQLRSNISEPVRDFAQDFRQEYGYCRIDDYIQYIPILSFPVLGFAEKSEHDFKDRLMIAAGAYAVLGVSVNTVKYSAKVMRPDNSTKNSFPSGHSATVFMGAELLRMEYGNAYGAAAYSLAVLTAGLRIYNNRHWLHDVLAGAGFGILSAHAGIWLLPLWHKLLPQENFALYPYTNCDFYGVSSGLTLAMKF